MASKERLLMASDSREMHVTAAMRPRTLSRGLESKTGAPSDGQSVQTEAPTGCWGNSQPGDTTMLETNLAIN